MTMKRYRENVQAGGMIEVMHPGSFFTLMESISPVDVEFMSENRVTDQAREMVPGLWFEPEKHFEAIRIWNREAYDVTVSFLVSYGRSGWNSPPPTVISRETSVANIAASAVVYGDVIDLGVDWAACVAWFQADGMTASAGGYLTARCADTPAMTAERIMVGQGVNSSAFVTLGGSTVQIGNMRPTGRYMRAQIVNGATAQGANARFLSYVGRNMTA